MTRNLVRKACSLRDGKGFVFIAAYKRFRMVNNLQVADHYPFCSVLGRLLDMINDKHLPRPFGRHQLQSKLLLDGREQRRTFHIG